MSRLIIYAGFHKTGTSAVQAAFRKASSALETAGVRYPAGYGKHAQHILAKISAVNTQEKRFRSIRRLTDKHETVLLASEFFSEQDKSSIQALKDTLGPEVKVEAVFSYRRLEQIVPSQYQQFIRTGYRSDISEFTRAIIEHDDSHHEARLFWRRHAASRILSDWVNAFGPENIHLINVERQTPELLTNWFESYLGLQSSSLESYAKGRMNRSLDLEELELVKSLAKNLPPERLAKEWKAIFRDKLIADIASRPSTNPNSPALRLAKSDQKVFEDMTDNEQELIRELGIQVHGQFQSRDRDQIADQILSPTSIHIETVARAISAIRPDHHLREASIGAMARELWYRAQRWLRGRFSKN